MSKISGVLPVVHTPFTEADVIDYESLERQVDWAFSQGIDGCCTGMVSELLRLTFTERIELTQYLGKLCRDRGTLVIGVGAESTQQALEYARCAEAAGATAVMAIPPTTSALPAEEVLAYFSALAEAVAIPVIVQDASGYVGQEIPMSVNLELLQWYGNDRILFKPEANPIGPKLSQLRDASAGRAKILEGSGGLSLVDSYRRGIVGTIPGMEFLPAVVALWNALQRGDEEAIYRLSLPLGALVSLQLQAGLDGFLAVEKYLLHRQGLFSTPARRRPYRWSLDEETRLEMHRLLDRLDAAVAAVQAQYSD